MERLASSQTKLARNVSRLRAQAGFTQEKLAERSLIDIRYLQKIEAGQTNPSLEILSRLRRAFKTSWDTLLRDAG